MFKSWQTVQSRHPHWKRHLIVGLLALVALQEFGFFLAVLRLKVDNPRTSAFMERDEGKIHYRFVPLSSISRNLRRAVIIAEDSRFFEHNGADWEAIGEAMEVNLKKRRWVRGGSTITQQLAKNLFLSPERTPFRKLRELILSYEMEWILGKKRILELYLNVVEWGDGLYGAELASRTYFKKGAEHLSASEAAWMAAILPNPDYYQRHPKRPYLQRKINTILSRMGD